MITAVDTNVILDVLTADSEDGACSRSALGRARLEGSLVVCEVVLAELAAAFADSPEALEPFLADAGLRLVRTPETALVEAGRLWRAYRGRGGSRSRLLADFLVAAHAAAVADRLLTRDRGFVGLAAAGLAVLDPHEPDPPSNLLRDGISHLC